MRQRLQSLRRHVGAVADLQAREARHTRHRPQPLVPQAQAAVHLQPLEPRHPRHRHDPLRRHVAPPAHVQCGQGRAPRHREGGSVRHRAAIAHAITPSRTRTPSLSRTHAIAITHARARTCAITHTHAIARAIAIARARARGGWRVARGVEGLELGQPCYGRDAPVGDGLGPIDVEVGEGGAVRGQSLESFRRDVRGGGLVGVAEDVVHVIGGGVREVEGLERGQRGHRPDPPVRDLLAARQVEEGQAGHAPLERLQPGVRDVALAEVEGGEGGEVH
mmetsp:Transcript_38363/g.121180  ORF Transcript_38363/g.121180 Transcript_38363/m.121180 type:complete len:277 (-) Transcript_38363:874-1704(-)